jgi:hypothetical protein
MQRDFLPRGFQADLDRFYHRVIRTALSELPHHDDVKTGEFSSMDEFLDNAEKQTSNLVVYEARRCFALTLAAIFERQLRLWAQSNLLQADEKVKVRNKLFADLLSQTAADHALDIKTASVGDTIKELHLLANTVRHGDGKSADKLQEDAPGLWPCPTQTHAVQSPNLSEGIFVSDADFTRYMRALTRFWGLADREFGAVIDVPY